METFVITANEIESSVTHRDDDMIESSMRLPILGSTVTLVVYLDPDHKTISDRQIGCLNRLLAVGNDRLNEIKTQLYRRWGEYDHFYTDEKTFEYNSLDEVYAASKVSAVYSHDLGTEHADCPVISFSVEWDPEHGAKVRYHEDKFEWCL